MAQVTIRQSDKAHILYSLTALLNSVVLKRHEWVFIEGRNDRGGYCNILN